MREYALPQVMPMGTLLHTPCCSSQPIHCQASAVPWLLPEAPALLTWLPALARILRIICPAEGPAAAAATPLPLYLLKTQTNMVHTHCMHRDELYRQQSCSWLCIYKQRQDDVMRPSAKSQQAAQHVVVNLRRLASQRCR